MSSTLMKRAEVKAFAKINLSLDIVGKREDGYHELRTVMQSVSLCDMISIEKTEGAIALSVSDKAVPDGEGNLAYKAASRFFEFSKIGGGAKIHIQKNIPSQAGLGGASADCAAVLGALNEMYERPLDKELLAEIGASLGADVAFCLTGGACLCEGVGEKLTTIERLSDCFIVIAKPNEGVSTPAAYAQYDKLKAKPVFTTDTVISALSNKSVFETAKAMSNSFSEAIILPSVDDIKNIIKNSGALGTNMSGSGSAVFGLFDDKAKAKACRESFSKDIFSAVCVPVDCGWEIINS